MSSNNVNIISNDADTAMAMEEGSSSPSSPKASSSSSLPASLESFGGGAAATDTATATNNNTDAVVDNNYQHQSSVSEAAEVAGAGRNAPKWISWLEYPFHVPDPKTPSIVLPEVAGWGMDSAGRGPLNQVGTYVGSAILRLAAQSAGCASPNCTTKIYGFLPSSLLTLTTSIVGVIAAVLMPIVGAIVDHTPYRRMMGVVSGFLAVVLIGAQIFINENNWFAMLIIDAIQTFVFLVHTTAVFAYLPDLSLDFEVISHYTSRFNFHQYSSQFVFVALIIIAGQVRGTDKSVASTVWTAKQGAAIAFTFGGLFIGYAWLFLFRPRPALSRVPEGSTLLTAGFNQVAKTSKVVWTKYRHLQWFMVSLLFSPEAGAGVILSIAVTYLTVFMRLSGQDIAMVSLCLMSGTMVGGLASKWICRFINPLNSYRLGLTLLAVFIAISVVVLKGPQHRDATLGMGVLWGLSIGIAYPSQRVLFCALIPKGQETEFMGLFVFTGQILGWLPALIFTIMNENEVDIRWGMGIIPFFCIMAVICTLPMGSYEKSVAIVAKDSEEKLASVIAATTNNLSCAGDEVIPSKSSASNRSSSPTPPGAGVTTTTTTTAVSDMDPSLESRETLSVDEGDDEETPTRRTTQAQ